MSDRSHRNHSDEQTDASREAFGIRSGGSFGGKAPATGLPSGEQQRKKNSPRKSRGEFFISNKSSNHSHSYSSDP